MNLVANGTAEVQRRGSAIPSSSGHALQPTVSINTLVRILVASPEDVRIPGPPIELDR